MRIVLVVHGFPPHECTGVETHVEALARALARRGLEIEVFSTRADPRAPDFALRSETREGFRLTWVVQNRVPTSAREHAERPGAVLAFGEYLDRVRPDLVHFHHVHKLGIGALEQAVQRGIASLYTAHDYFPACHRLILARPDLRRCESLGDARACARCDRAVAYLDGLGRWSDWQAGVLPANLDAAERSELARRLEQDDAPATREREALDRRRLAAFAGLDLLLAPTRFLREQLIAAGHARERIELCEYGIELAPLAELAAPRDGGEAPLRFGYLGGAHKHKGLQVLLEAYASLRLPAELHLHADSSDREHVAALRARAAQIGALWHGAYRAEQLPAILGSIDVLVVPSIWWENAPFVIREAFAAGRAVVASDVPALRESVQHEQDGLLVTPDDPRALADAMERLLAHPELAARLASGTRAPRSLDELCDELIARYQVLIARHARELPATLPPSVRGFAERALELERSTIDELAARASRGLQALARSLGCEAPAAQGATAAEPALERLRDARREIRWRIAQSDGGPELERLRTAHGEQSKALDATRAELERSRVDGERARAALQAANTELERRAAQNAALEGAQSAAQLALELEQRAHEQARSALQAAAAALAQASSERELLELSRARLQQELSDARARLQQGDERATRLEAELAQLAQGAAALQAHASWLEAEAAALAGHFGTGPQRLRNVEDFRAAHAAWQRIDAELRWRRAEMAALREEGGRLVRALVERSALGRRLRGWGAGA